MVAAAVRMKSMRARLLLNGMRELRLVVPDLRVAAVRQRIARQVADFSHPQQADALAWIEVVSVFDETGSKLGHTWRSLLRWD